MKPADALKIIRERAQDSGHIFILRHARQRMIERGVDDLDVQRCLRGGVITEGPYVPVDSRMYRSTPEPAHGAATLKASSMAIGCAWSWSCRRSCPTCLS
jgi:hypothetical protein